MRIKWLHLLALLGVMTVLPVLVQAREKPNMDLKLKAEKEVVLKDPEGKPRTEWREVKNFEPGDLLRYTITYTNTSPAEVRDAIIIDPIPPGTTFVSGSVEGKNSEITFSLDGKSFQSPPLLKYKVKSPGAAEQQFTATPEMYTHIRWKITKPVPAGGSGTVSFKIKVK